MMFERLFRPVLTQLPLALQTIFLILLLPLYIVYQNLYRRIMQGEKDKAKYGYRHALHAARDRLTPLFAHRHSYEQVEGWFRKEGYSRLELLRDDPLPKGIDIKYPLNVGIRGFRE